MLRMLSFRNMEAYACSTEQPSTNRTFEELREEEKPIFKFFLSDDNVDKLISFLSLEENKGQDSFDEKKFSLFKGLFRNFGNVFFPRIEFHLRRMIDDSTESNQRCAAEIIAGMLRGSKHWNFSDTQCLLKKSCEFLRTIFPKLLSETLEDWGTCLSSISMDRDSNRLAPIIELLLEDIIPEGEVSFVISSRLYLLQVFLSQQEWRVADCYHRLLKVLIQNLSNPYKAIRDKVGLLLYRVFMRDESISGCSETLSPHHDKFISEVLPQLLPLAGSSTNGGVYSSHITQTSHATQRSSCNELLVQSTVKCEDQVILHSYASCNEFVSPEITTDNIADNDQTQEKDILLINIMDEENNSIDSIKELPSPDDMLASDNFYEEKDELEKKIAKRIMNTVCKYVKCIASSYSTALPTDLYKFLPYLCQLESIDSDTELRNNCLTSLAYLSRVIIPPNDLIVPVNVIRVISSNGSWRARTSSLSFLQVLIFNNMFTIIENVEAYNVAKTIVLNSLEDPLAEVRQMAAQVLSGLIHSNFITVDEKFIDKYIQKLIQPQKKGRQSRSEKKYETGIDVSERHSGALGLCACVEAYPYDVPHFMPELIVVLSEHIHDPPPISTDIKLTISNFRRTHHDSWDEHKKNFSEDQLSVLTDVLISPSYYA
ncbi:UNVERIFIED_CONTAM: hypothetical protein RMT77_008397 [Armadillidium vulgare]